MQNSVLDIEVLWVSRFDYKQDWVLENHSHVAFYQLIYLVEGSCDVCINGGMDHVCAPAVLFFKPGTDHGLYNVGARGLRTLDTKFKVFNKMLVCSCDTLPPVIRVSDERILTLLEDIRQEGLKLDALYRENCQFIIGQILVRLVRFVRSKENKVVICPEKGQIKISDISSRVLEYIHSNCFKIISSSDLENEMGYTYRYIFKIFKNDLGLTPIEYTRRYRIGKAMELLGFGDYELKYIAEILGFPSVHDFSRAFKKITGVPPGRWRYENDAGICKDISINPFFKNENLIRIIGGFGS